MIVNIVRTSFINLVDGNTGYGVRIYDDQGNKDYDNTWEQSDIPSDDIGLFEECLNQQVGKEIFQCFTENDQLFIDGIPYQYNQIDYILREY